MNISAALQTLTQREKVLLGILGIAVFISGCVYVSSLWFPEKATSAQVVIPPPAQPKQTGKSEMPAKIEMNLTSVKNPFQIPPQYQVRKDLASAAGSGHASTGSMLPKPESSGPVLSGILSGGSTKMAIIEQGGNSETLGVGDTMSGYTVTAITDNQVVLNGPEGRMVLNLGR